MFKELFKFEWSFHSRQISFHAACLIFFLMGIVMGLQSLNGQNVQLSSPFNIAYYMGLTSLGAIFVATVFCVAAIMRDHEHHMDQLVHTTPVPKRHFLAGRFFGSLAAAVAVYSMVIPGMMVARFMPNVDAEQVAPFNLFAFLWPLLVFVLPNILLCASLLFTVAALSRRALATYVSGVALYFLYFAASALLNSPVMAQSVPATAEGLALAAILEPFGMNAFFEQTRYWTIHERNTLWFALEGNFLLNRLLWGTVSLVCLGLTYRFYAFKIRMRPGKKELITTEEAPGRLTLSKLESSSGGMAQWLSFKSMVSMEIKSLFHSWLFWAVQLMWLGLAVIELIPRIENGNFGSPSYPTTGLLLESMGETMKLFGIIILLYFGVEVVWRERVNRISELIDATPTSNLVFYSAKLATLIWMALVTVGLGFIAAFLIQAAQGWYHFQWHVYLGYFYYYGLPLILLSVLILLIQILCSSKYQGLMIGLVGVLVLHFGWLTGFNHFLLRYAGAPMVGFSDMNGFGSFFTAFNWFMSYWSACAVVIGLVTLALWKRGSEVALLPRLRRIGSRWSMPGRIAVFGFGLIFVFCGGFIFYNTNILNDYRSMDEVMDWHADYEKKYKVFEDRPSPVIVDANLKVDLFPKRRSALVDGTYQLANHHAEPIQEILLRMRDDVTVYGLRLEKATLLKRDKRFGTYHFSLDQPLQPGESLTVEVDLAITNKGFTNGAVDLAVVENGSFIKLIRCMPALGYRAKLELSNERERRKRGLAPQTQVEPADFDAEHEKTRQGRLGFEVIVSTDSDQIALAPGVRLREWGREDRRYFHYKFDEPIAANIGIMSARYAVQKVRYEGVDIEVYYHAPHDYNIGHMIDAARVSLDYYRKAFGPYQYPHLRVFEAPGHLRGFSGVGFAGTVGFLETRGFLADRSNPDSMDQVFRRIAHEVAHQWWGYQIDPADQPGAGFLIESFTKYSELLVLEKAYGRRAIEQFLDFSMDLYLRGRANEPDAEMPLYQAERSYLVYFKGAVVMYALRDLLGEAAVNGAMRRLLGRRDVTSSDFLAELYKLSPEEHHHLIDLWLKKIAVYDLRVISAEYEELAGGRYRLDMKVKARITETTGKGVEQVVPIHQTLEIGVFDEQGRALYLEPHFIEAEETALTLFLDGKPKRAGIDPKQRMIDRNGFDNLKTVTEIK